MEPYDSNNEDDVVCWTRLVAAGIELDRDDATYRKYLVAAADDEMIQNDDGYCWFMDSKELSCCDLEEFLIGNYKL